MGAEGTISVRCGCGKKLKAPAGSEGRKARCPDCGTTLIVKAGQPRAAVAPARPPSAAPKIAAPVAPPTPHRPSPPPLGIPMPPPLPIPVQDDPFDALSELAAQASSAPAISDEPRCPHCSLPMAGDAVLCVNCGYDRRTGRKVAVASVAEPAKPPPLPAGRKGAGKVVDYMAPTGSFVAGLVVSAVFALGASVVWFVVAWATGFAIGYIAILIGIAAGVGMQIGQKGHSRVGGVAAAAMTLGAIIVAKIAVIEAILARNPDSHGSIFNLDAAALAYYFFSPIGLIIIAIGMAAAFRTANGSVTG
jgi:DNA-directed RNA polymerase subunit RPC12/RpoP